MSDWLLWTVLVLAGLPAIMTVMNLFLLRRPPLPQAAPSIAVLIPARNEAAAIGACVDAALASTGADIEVIVLDDGSSDGTGAIVEARAGGDARLRLATAPPLPAGWNGKQHACHVLSGLTSRPVLLFIDADVRLAPEGAARLAAGMADSGADLISGVPRQRMGSLAERLLIPMINALILGYLPVLMMRHIGQESLGAGCGQLMMVRSEAYRAAGGHAAIRSTLHDGLKLPRLLRRAGFKTDLVDGTDLAECRMYSGVRDLVRGLLKNATEGMAKPVALPVWTVLLFGGHVLPWILLAMALAAGSPETVALTMLACALPLAARAAQALRCKEPLGAVPLHPVGVLALLAIQWSALVRRRLGIRTDWRGRAYQAQA
jgi:Glycosyltransferase like family 2